LFAYETAREMEKGCLTHVAFLACVAQGCLLDKKEWTVRTAGASEVLGNFLKSCPSAAADNRVQEGTRNSNVRMRRCNLAEKNE
jgi:hypothetical protein